MKTIVNKISDKHEDSFWYNGLIAETEHHELIANGEIDMRREGDNNFRCNGFKSWDETCDKDNVIYDPQFSNDNDLKEPYYFEMNNWFEILEKDSSGLGEVCDTYTQAIQTLKEMEDNHNK
jgi:hypothetical protein